MKVVILTRKEDMDSFKIKLKEAFTHVIGRMNGIDMNNPFLPGDWVKIGCNIKDSYGEIWHQKGDSLQVESVAKDGNGLMFYSNLGIHWMNVKRISQQETKEEK